MKSILKKMLSIFLISFLAFPVGFKTINVYAEDIEGIPEDLDEADQEIGDLEIEDSEVDTGLEIEEVELSERKDFTDTDLEHFLDNMDLISENEFLELYLHQTTTEIAVKVKKTGQIWLSNPVDRESDTVPSGENRAVLNSQVSITYFHLTGQTSRIHSDASVRNGQFEIEPIDNGVRVIYTLGDTSKGIEMIPKRITKKRFDDVILSKIDDESVKEELESRFEYVEEEDAYYPREVSFTSKIALDKTLLLFEEIGYTEEELAIDNAEAEGLEEEGSGKPRFVIPVQYKLDEDSLVVTVIGEEIEENESFPISEIKILEFFGAANEFREGYSFVPDGSGALIHLNNEKVNYQPYIQKVYGEDGAIFKREHREVSEDVRLPIYGMKQDDQAFLVIIEQGDGVASIESDVAGRLNSYNKVNNLFSFKEHGQVTLTGGERASTITMFQKDGYSENLQIRYGFLADEKANYSGMAEYYQNYLIDNNYLSSLEPVDELPFYLELVGTILKRKTFLGIPYQSVEDVTTFEEAEEIISELMEAGISNIKLRYSGWFNEGYKHQVPNKVKVDSAIGGKKGFKKLNDFLEENQIDIYPDVAFLQVHRNSLGFNAARHTSRFVNKRSAVHYPFNPASFRRDMSKMSTYILSPSKLPDYVKGFSSDYHKLNISGLSLRDMGSDLNSDFKEKGVINREEAKEIIKDQLGILEEQYVDVLAEGGNAYALPYLNHLLYAPANSSAYNITDESIPFYQMVIHGYIDYASKPINLSDRQDTTYQLLKSLETGSNIYFKWFYEDSSIIKETEFNDLISSNYKTWFNEAAEMHSEINSILNEVRTEAIVRHEHLEDGVYETTYSNGTSFIVNYNETDVNIDGQTIHAEGYVVNKGGIANVPKK